MDLMRLALSSIGANRPRLPFLPNVMLIAVILSACATATEPRIVEVTRQVSVEVTRTVSERVEVIREVPVEVTRVLSMEVDVTREVEVTRQIPVEVVKEVAIEVPVEVTRVVSREVEVTREVPLEVIKEVDVTRVVPVEVVKEVEVEKLVEVTREAPVFGPRIHLDPPIASPGDLVTVQGEGFDRYRTVGELYVVHVDVANRPRPITDAEGAFETVVLIPSFEPVPHSDRRLTLRVRVGDNTVRTNLMIVDLFPPSTSDFAPRIHLDPLTASPGDTVTVRGGGFDAFRLVYSLSIEDIDVTPSPLPSTDRGGVFETVILIPLLEPGAHSLSALAGDKTARTNLTILP